MLTVRSSAFEDGAEIPRRYTCDDANASPPLAWRAAPDGTRSFVVIVDDPDAPDPAAPKRVWVHWLVWNLPASAASIDEGATRAKLPAGAREGMNDGGSAGWTGPCPPIGRHRYFHRLYALDATIELAAGAKRAELERAMKGHVIGEAVVMGTYQHAG
jgi:Raf kinase inhibitor-like YbhB/YbcL family protein